MKSGEICDIFILFGVLAQLGACHTGSVEVTGSSPVYSIWLRQLRANYTRLWAIFIWNVRSLLRMFMNVSVFVILYLQLSISFQLIYIVI